MNIYHLANAIETLGWKAISTPVYPTIHLNVQPSNLANLDFFLDTLRKAVSEVKLHPKKYVKGPHAIFEEVQKLPISISEKAAKLCFHELCKLNNFTASK